MLFGQSALKHLVLPVILMVVAILAACAGPSVALPPATVTVIVTLPASPTPTTAVSSVTTPVATVTPTSAAVVITATATPTTAATVAPSPSPATTSQAPTVSTAQNATLGTILVDSSGMTLYIFKNDSPGQSTCTDTCAQRWPPLTVSSGTQPTAATGIPDTLGTITRSDGTTQVTYNGMPLYHYAGDTKPGDTNGQGLLNLWFAATP